MKDSNTRNKIILLAVICSLILIFAGDCQQSTSKAVISVQFPEVSTITTGGGNITLDSGTQSLTANAYFTGVGSITFETNGANGCTLSATASSSQPGYKMYDSAQSIALINPLEIQWPVETQVQGNPQQNTYALTSGVYNPLAPNSVSTAYQRGSHANVPIGFRQLVTTSDTGGNYGVTITISTTPV